MPEIQTVEKRNTSRYIDAYSHLDEWGPEFITIKVLAARRKPIDEDSWEGEGETTGKVVVMSNPYNLNRDEIRNMLYSHFSQSGCNHEYDCCGCMSTYASVYKLRKPREFRVDLSFRRNY